MTVAAKGAAKIYLEPLPQHRGGSSERIIISPRRGQGGRAERVDLDKLDRRRLVAIALRLIICLCGRETMSFNV